MDCSSSTSTPANMSGRHILNMSPRHSHHSTASIAELMDEIDRLEIEIIYLERHLLSLYRTAFQQYLPSNLENMGTPGKQMTDVCPWVTSDKKSQRKKLEVSTEYDDQLQSPTSSALAGLNDLVHVASRRSSSGRVDEKKIPLFSQRSLAGHLGNYLIDDFVIYPDRLSEDIIRCISSIYCKLGNPLGTQKAYSVSSSSLFYSSNASSSINLLGVWSPACSDEVTERCDSEGLEQENGPYSAMIEVMKISLDEEGYNYVSTMFERFRSLVKSLEIVDLKKMTREQKLAFWINIHNALVMHAYLAYGPENYIKITSILKASYNVGGHCVNAYDIQCNILGIKSHYSASWLHTLLSPGKKFKHGTTKHSYAVEYPEPLVHFALCSGASSDPPVRVYNAKTIFQDLTTAKEEFIQATVSVHKHTRIYLPKVLHYYAKDMSLGMADILEIVSECLPETQQKVVKEVVHGRPEKYVYWSEQSSSFRYLIHKGTAVRSD